MTSIISQESCQDWGFMGLGGVFSVEWIHKKSLPFQCTQHILNPWNDNKKVQISRDGQVRGRLHLIEAISLRFHSDNMNHLKPSCGILLPAEQRITQSTVDD